MLIVIHNTTKKHNKICFTYFTNKGNHVDTVREGKGGRN